MRIGKYINGLFFVALMLFQLAPAGIMLYNSYVINQWDDSPGWITDSDTGCKYYTNRNHKHRSIKWKGDCQDNLAHGKGTLDLFQGNQPLLRFEGALNKGIIDGLGRLIYLSDGDVYEGQFSKGRIYGKGHFYNDDGDHYEGYFEEGSRNGFGTYWFEPDDPRFKYVGQWKNDKMHGEGTVFYRNGEKKEGHYKNGKYVQPVESAARFNKNLPKNILITNDDGVEDMDRLMCLAEELSSFADKIVIAVSSQNRSGTSNTMILPKQGYLNVKCLSVDVTRQIYVYEVDGYPADCVFLGAGGIFHAEGQQVDLVISGINGGPNHGAEWFGSGTVGAARTAAIGKLPAIAISGIDEDSYNSTNLSTICKWVSDLVQSGIVEHIRPLEYLTVSIPPKIDQIKGSKFVKRAITFDNAPFYLEKSNEGAFNEGESAVWKINPTDPTQVYDMTQPHDISYYYQDYIVVVPMSVDENNEMFFTEYEKLGDLIPEMK